MALVSSRGIYAIAAILVLYRHTGGPLSIEKIATQANVPKNYLEQILLDLKRSGILKSVRGAKGGYTLAKDAKDITLLDVVQSVESECCADPCRTDNPVLHALWLEFNEHIKQFLHRPITCFDEYMDEI